MKITHAKKILKAIKKERDKMITPKKCKECLEHINKNHLEDLEFQRKEIEKDRFKVTKEFYIKGYNKALKQINNRINNLQFKYKAALTCKQSKLSKDMIKAFIKNLEKLKEMEK